MQKARALSIVLLVCLAAPAVFSQAPPSFEVASVRLNSEFLPATSGLQIRAEQVEAIAYPVRSLIAAAYGATRIEGAPDWTNRERYDIRARAPRPSSRQEMLQMLQTLLAERFQLKARRETRTMDTYGLVFAKGDNSLGSGMHPVKVDCETNTITDGPDSGLFPGVERPRCGTVAVGITMVSGPVLSRNRYAGFTMQRLADSFSGAAGRPVFDRTGLTGTFDVQLNYIRENPPGPWFSERREGAPMPDGVSFRDAIKQQLALDLRSERGPVEFLVIDAIERPKPN